MCEEKLLASKVTFSIGVVSRPLLLLLPAALKDPTESSCLDGELSDSGDGAFGPSSSGWATAVAVASTKNHQNLISSLLPLFHGIAPTFHSFVPTCSSPNLSISLFLPLLSSLGRLFQRTDHRACVA